jgi:hypothetical protein
MTNIEAATWLAKLYGSYVNERVIGMKLLRLWQWLVWL